MRKEEHVLFNDALNTFYLLLYGVIHMVKDHSDSERVNLLPPHGILFLISSKGSFISHRQNNTYHGLCYARRGCEMQLCYRVSANDVMGRRINLSWWTHGAISRSSQCCMTGVTKTMIGTILSVGWCI